MYVHKLVRREYFIGPISHLSELTEYNNRISIIERIFNCSKKDYGSIVHGLARKSHLAMLDPIHHQVLRLALGAFRTSTIASLYVEAGEPSFNTHREKTFLAKCY